MFRRFVRNLREAAKKSSSTKLSKSVFGYFKTKKKKKKKVPMAIKLEGGGLAISGGTFVAASPSTK